MDKAGRALLQQAISESVICTLKYYAPLRNGVVVRHVRPYELSVNSAGRPVLWGSCDRHGPKQLHAFRLDRIIEVHLAKRPTAFRPAAAVARWLDSFSFDSDDSA